MSILSIKQTECKQDYGFIGLPGVYWNENKTSVLRWNSHGQRFLYSYVCSINKNHPENNPNHDVNGILTPSIVVRNHLGIFDYDVTPNQKFLIKLIYNQLVLLGLRKHFFIDDLIDAVEIYQKEQLTAFINEVLIYLKLDNKISQVAKNKMYSRIKQKVKQRIKKG